MDGAVWSGMLGIGGTLLGVLGTRWFDQRKMSDERADRLLAIRREKLEQLALHLVESIRQIVVTIPMTPEPASDDQKGVVLARQILMLAQLYFPDLKQGAMEHLNAWTVLDIQRGMYRRHMRLGESHGMSQVRPAIMESRAQLSEARANLEAAIEECARQYLS